MSEMLKVHITETVDYVDFYVLLTAINEPKCDFENESNYVYIKSTDVIISIQFNSIQKIPVPIK